MKKQFCFFLAVCLPLLFVGCGDSPVVTTPAPIPTPGTTVSCAVTIGDHKLTAVEFNYYYTDAVDVFYSTMLDYGFGSESLLLDPAVPLNEQYYDAETETTWADHFVQEALAAAKEDHVLYDLAVAAGFSLSDAHKEELAGYRENLITYSRWYGYADVDDYLQSCYSPDSSINSYMAYKERTFLADAFYDYHRDSLTYSDDVLRAQDTGSYDKYNTDKMGNVRHLLVAFEGTEDEYGNTTYSDADKDTARAEAQGYLDMWKDGAANEEYFIELVKAHSDDTYLQTGGLYENITADSNYVDNFKYWATDPARLAGETGIIETEYGYHVMYFAGWSELSYRDHMITEHLRDIDQETWLQTALDGTDAEVLDHSGLALDRVLDAGVTE